MKKRTILFSAFLLLTACGGAGGEADCAQSYWDGTVGTCLPEGWTIVDSETLRLRGVPEETIAAFQTEEAVSGQFPTVTITEEELQQEVTADQYSDASIRSVEVLPGYELADTQNVSIDEENVQLHVFTLQPIEDEPRRRFYQISSVHEGTGYTATATTPLSVDSSLEAEVVLILEQLTFTAPAEE